MLTAAVIGCGDVSTVHFEALAAIPEIDLVAVCDTDPGRLSAAVDAFDVAGFADHRQLIEELRPDVVHICTPHHQHVAIALHCLERGISVIVEKPPAHNLEDGRRLVDAAERSAAKVAVCFQNRYNTTAQAMHRLLASGELGVVLGASATMVWQRSPEYYSARPWRGRWETSGGGLLMNQAIHTLDLIQWLVGDVTDVQGHTARHVLGGNIEIEDTAEMVLTHDNGARTVFYATLANVVNSAITLEIYTEAATLSLRGDLTVTYTDGRTQTVAEILAPSVGRTYWGVSHELLIRDFYGRLAPTPKPSGSALLRPSSRSARSRVCTRPLRFTHRGTPPTSSARVARDPVIGDRRGRGRSPGWRTARQRQPAWAA
jgi:UDP-N-acetyl-2-amino-2-deoxyglucuronate dehydrogenase